jgi:hypothetical protein
MQQQQQRSSMQYIRTHARGAKFSTYYNPPNHPQSSSSCGRHDQHEQHSILPDHHTNQLQLRTDCTARSISLSLFLSLCLSFVSTTSITFYYPLAKLFFFFLQLLFFFFFFFLQLLLLFFFFQQLLFFLFFFLQLLLLLFFFLFFFFLQLLSLFFLFFSCYNQKGILQSKAKQSKAS